MFWYNLALKEDFCMPAYYEALTHTDPSFPVIFHRDILSGASLSGAEAHWHMSNVEAHWHEGIELLYCISGSARVSSGAEWRQMTKGNLAVINSGALHYITAPPEKGCCYYCTIVEPSLFAGTGLPFGEVPLERLICDPETTAIYDQIIQEMEGKGLYYKEAVKGHLLLLFTRLYRFHYASGVPEQSPAQSDAVKRSILYLRSCFREHITIDEVCHHVGFSKYYFCRLFRKVTGRSIMEYVNYLRCAYAQQLLKDGEYNISETAVKSGFSDISYFTKVFKQQMGRLPSDVKKEYARENLNL